MFPSLRVDGLPPGKNSSARPDVTIMIIIIISQRFCGVQRFGIGNRDNVATVYDIVKETRHTPDYIILCLLYVYRETGGYALSHLPTYSQRHLCVYAYNAHPRRSVYVVVVVCFHDIISYTRTRVHIV